MWVEFELHFHVPSMRLVVKSGNYKNFMVELNHGVKAGDEIAAQVERQPDIGFASS